MRQQTYRYNGIIPHVSKQMVCLIFADDAWWLPSWEDHESRSWKAVEQVNAAMHDRFGIDVTTLRCFATTTDPARMLMTRTYEFENRSPAWTPPGRGRWVTRDALDALSMGDLTQRDLLVAWFTEQAQGIPGKRRLWARRGWFDATRNWIRDQVRMQGITLHNVEQVQTWERSCVLRAHTNDGDFYLKAWPPWASSDVQLMRALASWYPRNFPTIVAVEPDRRWLLTREFDGEPLESAPKIAHWEDALRRYAEIQIGLALRQQDLRDLGVPQHPIEEIPTLCATLFGETDSATPSLLADKSGLTPAEYASLREAIPRITTLTTELASYTIPVSLDAGDLRAENIIWTEAGVPLFRDWSDAAITHPFMSPAIFLAEGAGALAEADAVERLRAAYLTPWSLYKSTEDLRRALAIASVLGPLQLAITYQRTIVPALEQRWELEQAIPGLLRMSLEHFAMLPDPS